MWAVSTTFLAALTRSHQVITKVEAWRGEELLGEIPVSDGTVQVTARNRVRRTASLTVPASLWPAEPTDTLHPTGTELRVWRGINLGNITELVPVFTGRIDDADDRDERDGDIQVTCSDRMATVNDARFETPRAAPTGLGVARTIVELLVEAVPGAIVEIHAGVDTASVVPGGLLWERDRGQTIDDLAKSIGVEVYADAAGHFQIRTVPTIADTPVWTVAAGVNGTMVAAGRTVTRDGVYNVVVVQGERADNSVPTYAIVEDLDPSSPTRVTGPFRRVPRFLTSPFIAEAGQALTAGRALLARSVGAARTRTVTCVPNPALEAGDVITVSTDAGTELHIADSFSVPLRAEGGAMTIATRSTRVEAGDS